MSIEILYTGTFKSTILHIYIYVYVYTQRSFDAIVHVVLRLNVIRLCHLLDF